MHFTSLFETYRIWLSHPPHLSKEIDASEINKWNLPACNICKITHRMSWGRLVTPRLWKLIFCSWMGWQVKVCWTQSKEMHWKGLHGIFVTKLIELELELYVQQFSTYLKYIWIKWLYKLYSRCYRAYLEVQ